MLNVAPKSLTRLSKDKCDGISRYHGVVKKASHASIRWAAVPIKGGTGTMKVFDTQLAAAKQVAAWRQLQPADIRKQKMFKLTPAVMVQRFLKWHPSFKFRVPGDVETLLKHARLSRAMFRCEPAMLQFSALGKDGPWKDNLLKAFRGVAKKGKLGRDIKHPCKQVAVRKRASACLVVLCKAARLMDNVDMSHWIEQCNLRVMHVMGWVTMLRQHGVLIKVNRDGQNVVHVGKQNMLKYKVASSAVEKERAISKLVRAVDAGDALDTGIMKKPPKTVAQLVDNVDMIVPELRKIGAPLLKPSAVGKQNPYCVSWTLRAINLLAMETAGIKRISGDVSVYDFMRAFPDQGTWIQRLSRKLGVTSVAALSRKLKYDSPIQLLSMYACFYSSPTLDGVNTHVSNRKALNDILDAQRKIMKMDAIPPNGLMLAKKLGVL